MKLADHVDHLRTTIYKAFDRQFSRLGIGAKTRIDIVKLPTDLHAKRNRVDQLIDNHVGETGSYESAREKALDELTFTLFNRIAAVKVMEAASLFPPVITKQSEHGDRSFGHKAWLEEHPDMRNKELEGIREYLKHAFNELGETVPLYSKNYPYALLPDTLALNEIIDSFNAVVKDAQVAEDIWQSDDILGWLYESYNSAKKAAFKESKAKTEYDKVSLQSQVYTPRWVVQFLVENSLGKLYLEMYPDSEIKVKYKIANAPKSREREPKPLHEVKLIDPACGSGNFLLYSFDFMYELYNDQIDNYGAEYDENDVPQLIIDNNLHGIDLDDRAIQLAQLGLYIKARKKHHSIGSLKFNVVSSDFFLPDYEEVRHIFEGNTDVSSEQKALISEIWSDLQFAYKFGSLIHLEKKLKAKLKSLYQQRNREQQSLFSDKELGIKPQPVQEDLFTEYDINKERKFITTFFTNLETAVEQYARQRGNLFLTTKTRDAISFLEIVSSKYDVATTNPPYTDSGNFGAELKSFIEDNYKKPQKFNTNLYATFIKRCYEFTNSEGKIAMIHPHTFMFIKTFEDVRKFIIEKTHIDLMVDFGLDRVNLFGPGILLDATFYVLSKGNNDNEGLYFNLTTNLQEKFKKGKFHEALNNYIAGISNDRVYTLEQSKLKIIQSWPFIYWISDEFREKFGGELFEKYFEINEGLKTAKNIKYFRFFSEVNTKKDEKYITSFKGGPYSKWYGNLWLCIDLDGQRENIEMEASCSFSGEINYCKKGIVCPSVGTKGASFRINENAIFSNADLGIYIKADNKSKISDESTLAYLNSKLVKYITDTLNPTVNITVGDIKRIPYLIFDKSITIELDRLVQTNINIKKHILSFSIIENL